MPRDKVDRRGEYKEVVYDEKQWLLIREKRAKAKPLLEELSKRGIEAFIHGSVARGDVSPQSDVDIIIPEYKPSYIIELVLDNLGYKAYSREIIQATPFHTPKLYYILDPREELVVSVPLAKLLSRELEFYKWGGMIGLRELEEEKRVAGVNKKLKLIIPTPTGHIEIPVIGREAEVASILGISIETVNERVRVLTRRDEIGRTGVFLKISLREDEVPESVLRDIASKNPMLRRVLRDRGY